LKLLEKLGPFKMALGKRKALLGVDIGSNSLKIVEIRGKRDQLILNQAHVVPLPPGKVTMGTIEDPEGLASELDTVWNTLQLKNRNISLALPGNLTILRRTKLPYVPPEEIEKAIQWDIEKVLPFKLEEIHFDFHVYEIKEGENIDLVYVVAKRNVIETYQQLFVMAGINLEVLDSTFLALANIAIINYEELKETFYMILDIGAESSNLMAMKNDRILYCRNVEVGGDLVTQCISRHLSCSTEEAERLKLAGDVEESILREGAQTLASKLHNEIIISLNYAQNILGSQEPVEKILVTGGGSNTLFLIQELGPLLNTNVQPMSPIRRVELDPHLDPTHVDEISSRLSVAMGTGLKSVF